MRPAEFPFSPSPFENLYAEHHTWLQGWLRRQLGDTFSAADLAQDTFLSVLTAGTARQIVQPRPFLATIARRLVWRHRRRLQLESAYLEWLAGLPASLAPSAEAHLSALQALQQVDRALDGLPAKVKEAFLLAQFEGLGYAEIAQRLKVSSSSVKQYLTRANRQCLFSLP